MTTADPIPAPDPLLAALQKSEYGREGMAGVLVALGIAITFVCVLVVAIALKILLWSISFIILYGIVLTLVVAGIAFLETQTRSGFWAQAIEPDDFISPASFFHRPHGSVAQQAIEMVLVGPRMLLAGWHRLQSKPLPRLDEFLARCAVIVYTINDHGSGLPIAKLTTDTELPDDLLPHLQFLDSRGWIGISSDGNKAWLSTPGEKRLRDLGIMAAPAR